MSSIVSPACKPLPAPAPGHARPALCVRPALSVLPALCVRPALSVLPALCVSLLVACTSPDQPEPSPTPVPTQSFTQTPTQSPCVDAGASPDQEEQCDGLDNNCDGQVDEGVLLTFYPDADGDGFGAQHSEAVSACMLPANAATNAQDCDDNNANVSPSSVEIVGNTIDENCDQLAPQCSPSWRLSPLYPQEGQTLQLQLECAGEAALSAYTVSLEGLPAGATWDATANVLSWSTGLSSAGSYTLSASLEPIDPVDTLMESFSYRLDVADAVDDPANVPPDPLAYPYEWGLPVIQLFPQGTVSESYVPAQIVFQGKSYDAELKIRGGASTGYPKNSYTLNFGAENLDASAFGLPDKDHLVLISTFDDNSYVRQKLAYDTWQDMASFWQIPRMTPRTFFVVVYLDNHYWGLYTACDHIDDQFLKQMGLNRDGNLYKAVSHDANFYLTDPYGYPKISLHQGYEKKEGLPADGEDGAWDDLDALVDFTGGSSNLYFSQEVSRFLREDEFMDWFLFVHFLSAGDSAGKNAYLYNDPAAYEFRYCPWDFNQSFGQNWLTQRVPWDIYEDFYWANSIFSHLESYPVTSGPLWDRLAEMMVDGPLTPEHLGQHLDEYYALIEPSAQRDWDHWGSTYQSFYYWADSRNAANDWTDYAGEKAYIRSWVNNRFLYMAQVHPF